jgi:hypothetical protein
MTFHHPKYYAALRAERRKQQATSKPEPVQVQEATSVKPQQTSSDKRQAKNNKQEVSSPK